MAGAALATWGAATFAAGGLQCRAPGPLMPLPTVDTSLPVGEPTIGPRGMASDGAVAGRASVGAVGTDLLAGGACGLRSDCDEPKPEADDSGGELG